MNGSGSAGLVEQYIGLPSRQTDSLRRIWAGNALTCAMAIYLLLANWGGADTWLQDAQQTMGLAGPLSRAATASLLGVVTATIARAFMLHQLALGRFIRPIFDVAYIIAPLAEGCGYRLSPEQLSWLRQSRNRNDLLERAFYRFAGDDRDSDVSPYLIARNLDGWSWFWVFSTSAILLFGLAVVGGLMLNVKHATGFIVGGSAIAAALAAAISFSLPEHSRRVARAILHDPKRRAEVLRAFNDPDCWPSTSSEAFRDRLDRENPT